MALDTRIPLSIQPPAIDDPQVSMSRVLANQRSRQLIAGGELELEDARAKADQARTQRMREADVQRILANSPSPFEAAAQIDQLDPERGAAYRAKLADTGVRLLQGVTNYQAIPSVWPTLQKYLGPSEVPQFQNQQEFDAWKRQQMLAHADVKTYLSETKPANETAPTQASIAMAAAKGDADAGKALELLRPKADGASPQGFTLSPGQVRYGADGKPLASAPNRPATGGGAKPTQREQDVDALAQTVIANPALFDQLTPTDKGRIAPKLRELGFDGFGKPLPAAAVKQISDTKTAIDSLNDLKTVLKENERYIGPVAGLQAMNPYSEARQAQARIDLVRQRVGKALEGGVLRKEDEEKYKMILATLRDTPSTAIYKVDSLIHSLDQDVQNFIGQQRLSGRRVSQEQADSVKPSAIQVTAPNGKTYSFKSKADADAFKTRAGIK